MELIDRILFIDIETVPQKEHYKQLSKKDKELWNIKCLTFKDTTETDPALLYESAGLFAEFGTIVCVSVGVCQGEEISVKSYYGDDEELLLKQLMKVIKKVDSYNYKNYLCAHNGKNFDFPFLCRRAIIHGLEVPDILITRGKYAKDILLLDTLEMWKFGEFHNYTSLSTLTHLLNIPSPKDDIMGAQVRDVYYKDKDIMRIVKYCSKDVIALIQVYRKLKALPLVKELFINVNYDMKKK